MDPGPNRVDILDRSVRAGAGHLFEARAAQGKGERAIGLHHELVDRPWKPVGHLPQPLLRGLELPGALTDGLLEIDLVPAQFLLHPTSFRDVSMRPDHSTRFARGTSGDHAAAGEDP